MFVSEALEANDTRELLPYPKLVGETNFDISTKQKKRKEDRKKRHKLVGTLSLCTNGRNNFRGM